MKASRLSPEDKPLVFSEILADLPAFWGERDIRALHQPAWFRQFAADAVVVREHERLSGYLLGTVSAHGLAYVHLIATRVDQRGRGIGRLPYNTLLSGARQHGATRAQAITTTSNTGSIAFHRRLGFSADVVPDYAGPQQPRVLFDLPLRTD